MNDEPAVCAEEKPEKHIVLYRSINDIASINKRLDGLITRITSQEQIEEKDVNCTKHRHPSLSDILESGASDINENINNAHSLIDKINNILF